jgi:ATP phosphoribosyltransferase regulatory subunit
MPISETWLLPDGVADVLPEQAQVIESLRRKSLDFLASRGYQLVYTPFIEYIESLSSLSESNQTTSGRWATPVLAVHVLREFAGN